MSTYKIPTRAMAGNGNVRDSAVDDVVAVDRNGLVDHDESVWSSSSFLF